MWSRCSSSSSNSSSSSDEVWADSAEESEDGELNTSDGHTPHYSPFRDRRQRALGNLEFWKRSLILQITGNIPEYLERLTPEDLEEFGKVPREREESFLCELAHDRKVLEPVGMTKKHWARDANEFTIPEFNIDVEDHCTYKGRSPFAGGNALQRILGEDSVVRVQFEDVRGRDYNHYRMVLEHGFYFGFRYYAYFIHKETVKDKGKSKPGQPRSASVKCFFVCLQSDAPADGNCCSMTTENLKDLRNYFCHIYQTPTIAKFIARQQLLLTKTIAVDIDLSTVTYMWRTTSTVGWGSQPCLALPATFSLQMFQV